MVLSVGEAKDANDGLRTGMKCLPASKLPQANGVAIHDWHAEILTIRAFNRFVLEECKRLALQGDGVSQSEFIYRRTTAQHKDNEQQGTTNVWQGQPYAWREDVSLHMYCSEAPCTCPRCAKSFIAIDESQTE